MNQVVDRRAGDSASPTIDQLDMSDEAKARRMGWYPRDEFRGPPEQWIPAEDFVKRAESELPILKDRLRRLDERAAKTEYTNRTLQANLTDISNKLGEMGEAFDSMRDMSSKAEQRGFDRAIAQIKKDAAAAAADGDAAGVTEALEKVEELMQSRVKPDVAPATATKKAATTTADTDNRQQPDPVAVAWANSADREWYRADRRLHALANAEFEELMESKRDLPIAEKLAEVERKVASMFPSSPYFVGKTGGKKPVTAAVSDPSNSDAGVSPKGNRTFDALPKEARAEFDKIAKGYDLRKGKPGYKPYTKEEFLTQYHGPQEEQ